MVLPVAPTRFTGLFVGPHEATPAKGAIFEVNSTEGGFLLPRVQNDDGLRSFMSYGKPLEGMLMYNRNRDKVCFFTGNNWFAIDAQQLI